MIKDSIALVGGGTLAKAILNLYAGHVKIFSHSDFDIGSKSQCDTLISELVKYNSVIITAGHLGSDYWDTWMTNTVGPCYLIGKLNAHSSNQRIIVISSYGARWTSWPEISMERLHYNMSKRAVSDFVHGLIQRGSNNQLTVIEPSKFQSPMSKNKGVSVADMAQQIIDVLENQLHVITLVLK
jgi:NAD(P)-dependent dehydrogenase (short-subunit alcohol dehydrogenase family)